ncbi:hypothetical protein [Leptolyngbya sp. CCY15150]|uniref:hypothetical protein n=1 Tax=Leptolyngbya sp. CCY15150 TaxID=2767772 RepID=UPI00195162D3|nr:hypothetical protein [Leptolyngbya sp. CCY15150]
MVTKDFKLWVYPAVAGVIGLALLAWVFRPFDLSIQIEPVQPDVTPGMDDASSAERSLSSITNEIPQAFPATADDQFLVSPDSIPANADLRGHLRVSNRSIYPVRVALLARPGDGDSTIPEADLEEITPSTTASPPPFTEPVHWDFAPAEGSARGLMLSLPDQDLSIQPGDIVVAFAQDGSRHYWGPFVVGQTPIPAWHTQDGEWHLVLTEP